MSQLTDAREDQRTRMEKVGIELSGRRLFCIRRHRRGSLANVFAGVGSKYC